MYPNRTIRRPASRELSFLLAGLPAIPRQSFRAVPPPCLSPIFQEPAMDHRRLLQSTALDSPITARPIATRSELKVTATPRKHSRRNRINRYTPPAPCCAPPQPGNFSQKAPQTPPHSPAGLQFIDNFETTRWHTTYFTADSLWLPVGGKLVSAPPQATSSVPTRSGGGASCLTATPPMRRPPDESRHIPGTSADCALGENSAATRPDLQKRGGIDSDGSKIRAKNSGPPTHSGKSAMRPRSPLALPGIQSGEGRDTWGGITR